MAFLSSLLRSLKRCAGKLTLEWQQNGTFWLRKHAWPTARSTQGYVFCNILLMSLTLFKAGDAEESAESDADVFSGSSVPNVAGLSRDEKKKAAITFQLRQRAHDLAQPGKTEHKLHKNRRLGRLWRYIHSYLRFPKLWYICPRGMYRSDPRVLCS